MPMIGIVDKGQVHDRDAEEEIAHNNQMEVLQVWRLELISLADASRILSLRSFQVAAIRTGGDPDGGRVVLALFPFVPRRGGVACRARAFSRPSHRLEVGAELRPGNGTPFALEAQSDQRQLAGG
jgi:hypothetical protein